MLKGWSNKMTGEETEAGQDGEGGFFAKNKLILIVAGGALLLLLAAGGGVAYVFLGSSGEETVVEEAEPSLPVEPLPILVEVRGVLAPIVENGMLTAHYHLDLNIQVPDRERETEVKLHMPKLRDAMARSLYAHSIANPEKPGTADLDSARARLLAAARKALGEEAVTDLYIKSARPGAM